MNPIDLESEIRKRLELFYPFRSAEKTEIFWKMPEVQELENRIVETVHENGDEYVEWKEWLETVSESLGVELKDLTNGQSPCFKAVVSVNSLQKEIQNLEYKKEIWLFYSLIGNYFSIIGTNWLSFENAKGTNVFIQLENCISPCDWSSDIYNELFKRLNAFHNDSKFINYQIGQMPLGNILLPHIDRAEVKIFDALFEDFYLSEKVLIGNVEYHNDFDSSQNFWRSF